MSFKENSFSLTKSGTNVTTGTFSGDGSRVFWCRADGNLTVTYQDNSTATVSLEKGDAINFVDAKTVAISTGTYFVS